MPDAHELGRLGEELATRALLRAGCSIEGRRVRTPQAEVDVLAREGRTLVLVEVKTARVAHVPGPRGALRDPSRSPFRESGRLDRAQRARLLRCARAMGKSRRAPTRVDLVEVWLCARTGAVRIDHRRNA